MFWKKEKKENPTEQKLNQMNELLKKSFSNVKKDTTNIFQWLKYFYKRNMVQEETIKRLQTELSYMPRIREDIRRIIDDYYSFEGMMSKMRELSYKVDELAKAQLQLKQIQPQTIIRESPKEVHIGISAIEKRLENLEQKKMSIKERIIKRLTRNSKEYVKSIILSYIRKYEKISALQLKEIIVDEQRLCSKSSFYRLLEEAEQSDQIGVVKQGKEKHYFSKIVRHV